MESALFTPTRDWGNELWASLMWIAQAWTIAAIATLVICVLLARYTVWGRQFWRITGDYFTGAESVKVWLWLAVILFLVLVGVRLSVLLSYQSNDMLTSFQVVEAGREAAAAGNDAVKQSGRDGFYMSITVFSVLAAIFIARLLLDMFLVQRFCLAWRAWLTDRLTGDWLDGKAYYRARFIDDKIDNPDQRIQSDIDIFTAGNGPLPNVPYYYSPEHSAVRRDRRGRFDDLLHRDPVEPVRAADDPVHRLRASEGDVLDRDRLRSLRIGDRLLDRQADHLAVVPQREVQRRVPVRPGATARRVGGGRLLPRRGRRAHRPAASCSHRSSATTSDM